MVMETYADILRKRKEGEMTNYDMDEIERERDRNAFATVKKKEKTTEVEIELPSDDLLILALAAHDRDITLNQLVNNVLRDTLKNFEYKSEHGNKPQFLAEKIEPY